MAAKKKTSLSPSPPKKSGSSTSKSAGASAVKKMSTPTTTGPTYKGKAVNWGKPGTRPAPTEAFTQKGQKATGLSSPTTSGNRFSSKAKGTGSETKLGTFVYKASETVAKGAVSLSGAGAVAKAVQKPTKGNIVKAVASVAPLPIGKIGSYAAKNTYALGKTVVHGSPVQGLKSIRPTTGSAARPKESVNFSWNPKAFNTRQPQLANQAAEYAGKAGKPGSYYVGKVRRRDIVSQEPGIIIGKGAIKVTKEIKQTNSPLKDAKSLERSLRSPANTKNKLVELSREKRRKAQYRKSDKKSVV
jgi:hypothetical protein